jgi:hypothetical protein
MRGKFIRHLLLVYGLITVIIFVLSPVYTNFASAQTKTLAVKQICLDLDRDLQLNSKGPDVAILNNLLLRDGYLKLSKGEKISNIYTKSTELAVADFALSYQKIPSQSDLNSKDKKSSDIRSMLNERYGCSALLKKIEIGKTKIPFTRALEKANYPDTLRKLLKTSFYEIRPVSQSVGNGKSIFAGIFRELKDVFVVEKVLAQGAEWVSVPGVQTFFKQILQDLYTCRTDPNVTQGCGLVSLKTIRKYEVNNWPDFYVNTRPPDLTTSEQSTIVGRAKTNIPAVTCEYENYYRRWYDFSRNYHAGRYMCDDGSIDVALDPPGWYPDVMPTLSRGYLKYKRPEPEESQDVEKTIIEDSKQEFKLHSGIANRVLFLKLRSTAEEIKVHYEKLPDWGDELFPFFTATPVDCRKMFINGIQANRDCTVYSVGYEDEAVDPGPLTFAKYYTYTSSVSYFDSPAVITMPQISPSLPILAPVGTTASLSGNGFSNVLENIVELKGEKLTFTIGPLASTDGKTLSFVIPNDISIGTYTAKVNTGKSVPSNGVPFNVTGANAVTIQAPLTPVVQGANAAWSVSVDKMTLGSKVDVDWGDGTMSTQTVPKALLTTRGGLINLNFNHAYDSSGTFIVSALVTNGSFSKAGASGVKTLRITSVDVVEPVVPKPTRVIYPNGGQTFSVGETKTVLFDLPTTNDSVLVYLQKYNPPGATKVGVNSSKLLGQTASGENSFTFQINDAIALWPGVSDYYKIKVCSVLSGCGVNDSSDEYFSIISAPIASRNFGSSLVASVFKTRSILLGALIAGLDSFASITEKISNTLKSN